MFPSTQKDSLTTNNATSYAPTKSRVDVTSFALLSKASVGKISSVSRRAKAVPLKSMFKTEVESVKQKNVRKMKDEPVDIEPETKFNRWERRRNS